MKIAKNIYLIFLLFTIAMQAIAKEGYTPVTGAKLYYQSIGTGTPIIVLHGGPGLDQTYLLPQMSKIAKNHEVIFYDQRGSGKSLPQTLDSNFITITQFVKDLEQLRKALGYKQFIIIGHSWGGRLAMTYAIKYPQHVKAMILMNSAPADSLGFESFANEYQKRTKPIQNEIDAIQKSSAFIHGDVRAFNNYAKIIFSKYLYKETDINKLSLHFSSTTAKNSLKIINMMNREKYDIKPQLKKLKIPTLIIHGETDPIPLWTAKQTAETIPGAQLVVIKKSGHFSFAEQPDEVSFSVDRFI